MSRLELMWQIKPAPPSPQADRLGVGSFPVSFPDEPSKECADDENTDYGVDAHSPPFPSVLVGALRFQAAMRSPGASFLKCVVGLTGQSAPSQSMQTSPQFSNTLSRGAYPHHGHGSNSLAPGGCSCVMVCSTGLSLQASTNRER